MSYTVIHRYRCDRCGSKQDWRDPAPQGIPHGSGWSWQRIDDELLCNGCTDGSSENDLRMRRAVIAMTGEPRPRLGPRYPFPPKE